MFTNEGTIGIMLQHYLRLCVGALHSQASESAHKLKTFYGRGSFCPLRFVTSQLVFCMTTAIKTVSVTCGHNESLPMHKKLIKRTQRMP